VVVFSIVLLLAVAAGVAFLLLHNATSSPTATRPSASASATPSALPDISATPSAPIPTGPGVVACPIAAPTGQHPLGNPAGPGEAQHADPTLDFCGAGSLTLPPGTARFTTGDNWGLGVANSCPPGSAGSDGMGQVLTITEVLPDGSAGIDTDTQQGDWTDDGGTNMSTGGNYQVKVQTVSPSCVWHIAIYPS
jgi:hypothetical protein